MSLKTHPKHQESLPTEARFHYLAIEKLLAKGIRLSNDRFGELRSLCNQYEALHSGEKFPMADRIEYYNSLNKYEIRDDIDNPAHNCNVNM